MNVEHFISSLHFWIIQMRLSGSYIIYRSFIFIAIFIFILIFCLLFLRYQFTIADKSLTL